MRFVVVTGNETREEIAETIRNLRAKQAHACIPSTAREYADDIDELLERYWPAPA